MNHPNTLVRNRILSIILHLCSTGNVTSQLPLSLLSPNIVFSLLIEKSGALVARNSDVIKGVVTILLQSLALTFGKIFGVVRGEERGGGVYSRSFSFCQILPNLSGNAVAVVPRNQNRNRLSGHRRQLAHRNWLLIKWCSCASSFWRGAQSFQLQGSRCPAGHSL